MCVSVCMVCIIHRIIHRKNEVKLGLIVLINHGSDSINIIKSRQHMNSTEILGIGVEWNHCQAYTFYRVACELF